MRHPRKITAEEENFRTEEMFPGNPRFQISRRDPIKPEPEGAYVLRAFKITDYNSDCDGSLMWRGCAVDFNNPESEGCWEVSNLGLYEGSSIIVTKEELKELYEKASK
jgi:hypothetical protein